MKLLERAEIRTAKTPKTPRSCFFFLAFLAALAVQFSLDQRERREALADRLRTLLGTWTPPELTPGIVDTARQLLKAEGDTSSPEGWDAASWESPSHDPGAPPEDYLLWPEGIPAVLKGKWPPST
ncbi:hypothetical protein [Sorangium sp. So ce1024]|uniref:hypothetical protein n=1 Tax=Sorangium sp. So ce1024 TaxID=3133327 RepID=UPI003EFEB105